MSGKLKIIGGQWRSRIIRFKDAPGLRPTPARLREKLFNWLQADIQGSVCLDLFAGSGALGFEAVSRGAEHVVQVESNPKVCQQLKANALELNMVQLNAIRQDVETFLAEYDGEMVDLVFMDPPFAKGYAASTCWQLEQVGCLKPFAKIYVEVEKSLKIVSVPESWTLLKTASAGDVMCFLYRNG